MFHVVSASPISPSCTNLELSMYALVVQLIRSMQQKRETLDVFSFSSALHAGSSGSNGRSSTDAWMALGPDQSSQFLGNQSEKFACKIKNAANGAGLCLLDPPLRCLSPDSPGPSPGQSSVRHEKRRHLGRRRRPWGRVMGRRLSCHVRLPA